MTRIRLDSIIKPMKILLVAIAIVVVLFACTFSQASTLSKEAVSYHKQAEEALKRSDIDEAITFYQKTIALDDTDALAHNILGVLYDGKNRLELAEQEYLKALSLEPKYLDALVNLARFYEKAKRKDKAIELWEKFLTFAPAKDKMIPEAKSKIIELTTPGERKSDLVKKIENEQADKLAKEIAKGKQLLKKENDKKSKEHFKTAKSYYDKKQCPLALEEFNAALKYDPTNSDALKYIKLCQDEIIKTKKNK